MNKYWEKRIADTQNAITSKRIKQIEKQLQKYYVSAAKTAIRDFENVYDKILSQVEKGQEPTPALLYKLDKYWEAQGQLRRELEKLGNKQIALFTKYFELNYFDVYYSFSLEGRDTFNTLDKDAVNQLINVIWLADGKNWSDRIWDNTERLAQTLNEELVHCVITGKSTSALKEILQERFNISHRRADTLVRTEMAHLQTQAAQKRYKDYGIEYVEVLVDVDERTCDKCKALVGKKFRIDETPPLPVHPNERCALVPVID